MREAAVDLLTASGYYEHPTTYFPKHTAGPEIWRALNLDQDKQYPQLGVGLGTYSWCAAAEAHLTADPRAYLERVGQGELPFRRVTGTSRRGQSTRAIRMALSTCQSLRDDVHRQRFGERSLLAGRRGVTFYILEKRGLMTIDHQAGALDLTRAGKTLVEAIINTEIT
jgi:oxygen-independent coproporphyrinogen-3 oxidase